VLSTAPLDRESRVGEAFDRGKLVASEDSGEAEVTVVLVSTSHTCSYPPLNRYHTQARAAACMADDGARTAAHLIRDHHYTQLPPR
jgi:hypothetical protein